MTERKKDVGNTLEQVWGWVQKATWPKIALGVLAIVVGVWQLNESDARIANQGKRLTALEQGFDKIESHLDRIDGRTDRIDRRFDDLEDADDDLNRSISQAVERGIKRGIDKVLQQLGASG